MLVGCSELPSRQGEASTVLPSVAVPRSGGTDCRHRAGSACVKRAGTITTCLMRWRFQV